MKLLYPIQSMCELRRDLLTVVEAHAASTGTEAGRALCDAFICLVKELQDDGYHADQIAVLANVACELEASGGTNGN